MSVDLSGIPESERTALENDRLVLVDADDTVVGSASKLEAHLAEKPLLHRAFSVFLFSYDGSCYLQKRAATKTLFPGLVANTVCSHPHDVADERDGWDGVDVAARRRLKQELGLELPDDFRLIPFRRVLYRSSTVEDTKSGPWVEMELDYILIGLLPSILMDSTTSTPTQMRSPWKTKLNANEVEELRAWTMEEVEAAMLDTPQIFSPWFRLLYEAFIRKLWVRMSAAIRGGNESPESICHEMAREKIIDLRESSPHRMSMQRAPH